MSDMLQLVVEPTHTQPHRNEATNGARFLLGRVLGILDQSFFNLSVVS